MTKYEILLRSGQRVFNLVDLSQLWRGDDYHQVLASVKDYARRGKLIRLYRGIYALSDDFHPFELAQKLVTPSYITCHTALATHGITFQFLNTVHSFALKHKRLKVAGTEFIYHQVKPDVVLNPIGIKKDEFYYLASPERAVADSLYLNSRVGFDNLEVLDADRLYRLANIYPSARARKDILKLAKSLSANHKPSKGV